MDVSRIDNLLGQMRAAAAQAKRGPLVAPDALGGIRAGVGVGAGPAKAGGVDFAQSLRSAVERVEQTQQHANRMTQAFEVGSPDAPLHDVMISVSKANISFQQMVQVRNRLVQAYHEVMNMQV